MARALCRLTTRQAVILIVVVVAVVWLIVLKARLPYLNQIPIYDADVTTSFAVMSARNWWIEGPWNLWFSTPYAPASIELPTIFARRQYQSWPPGAYIPIYITSLLSGTEPTVPMANWLNAVSHGIMAVAISLSAYFIFRLNRCTNIVAAVIAAAVAFPALYPRGLVYGFSQLYCVTINILVYAAIFLLLQFISYVSDDRRTRRRLLVAQLAVIFVAFFVDWLAYTLYAVWFGLRLLSHRLGYLDRWSWKTLGALGVFPLAAFAIYVFWRLNVPNSIAAQIGIWESLYELGWKIAFRANLTDAFSVADNAGIWDLQVEYFAKHVPWIIGSSVIAAAMVLSVSFIQSHETADRRIVWLTICAFILVTIPFYLHMLVFIQHTKIHTWAVLKTVFAYSLVPFAVLPGGLVTSLRRSRYGCRQSAQIVLVAVFGGGAYLSARTYENEYLMSPINLKEYRVWETLRRNTAYEDVVFSPTLRAEPIQREVGVGNKLVYPAKQKTAGTVRAAERRDRHASG